ncbi:MAG: sensor histidine kinase [bacterium]
MSLRNKIIFSFLISSAVIAVLAITSYIHFIEIKREIRFLEFSDTIRSKSLQLRRHEKNFFLYRERGEAANVHAYTKDLRAIVSQGRQEYRTGTLESLEKKIEDYEVRFNRIESLAAVFQKEFDRLKPSLSRHAAFFTLIESTILERPLVNAELLGNIVPKRPDALVQNLTDLDGEITALRKTGEEIISLSKDIDRVAREKADRAISDSQRATLFLFPLFLAVGLVALFLTVQSIVKRLAILRAAIEQTGKGTFAALTIPGKQDEVGVLMLTFNKMEEDLIARDQELRQKSEELLQSKKLASLGTLASGVAHELNNPLNNIYLAAQILSKEMAGESYPPLIRETVEDIFSQTQRVKRIVSDLLEFAREKAPELKRINIAGLIEDVLSRVVQASSFSGIALEVDMPHDVEVSADRLLLEQVFINLFSNAADAMAGRGTLGISIRRSDGAVRIRVSDSGKGVRPDDMPKIFDPFFTTKEKGTGLGLSIVYNIMKKHNGSIDVKSEPGKGATFTLTLPEVS